jgi:tetratricopeptide (TPR) repeat protein
VSFADAAAHQVRHNRIRYRFVYSREDTNMKWRSWTFVLTLALLAGLWGLFPGTSASAHGEEAETPLLGNLGDHQRTITTDSEEAQAYFDQGLVLAYGFHHELAIKSFQEALKHDPECAMCYWGIAWALGPNINLPMDPALNPDAWAALQQAQALAEDAGAVEQAFIDALAARYSEEAPETRAELDLAFAEAMGEVAEQYPDDADALAIYAEAMMDLTPWNFWTADGEATEYTERILATLEAAMALNPDHPAANHYYIHATEASRNPERALESARRLETLVPGAGHLSHMPAHTYWRTGRYADAARVNVHAAHADETTFAGTPDPGAFYPVLYYPHNIHFLSSAAQMMGDSKTAIDSARRLVAAIPEQVYAELPLLEDFRPMPYHALVRFGRWEEILDEPAPGEHLPFANAMWHYARGVALANLDRMDEAREELAAIEEAKGNPAFEGLVMASFASAQQNLDMATAILSAAIAGAEGDHEAAITQLEAAVAIQDSLPYIEPPAWYFPIRQLLGAELLAAGQAEAAEAVYRIDLEQYPASGWSLFGLAQALDAQGEKDEADTVRSEFEEAWRDSDVVLAASACPCEMAATGPAEGTSEAVDEAALVAELMALEEDAGGHHHSDDAEHATKSLGEDFIGIMANGERHGREEMASVVTDPQRSAKTHARDEAEAIVLSPDAVLLVYPLTLSGETDGQSVTSQEYISSLWVKRGGNWQQVFMQSTPIATE